MTRSINSDPQDGLNTTVDVSLILRRKHEDNGFDIGVALSTSCLGGKVKDTVPSSQGKPLIEFVLWIIMLFELLELWQILSVNLIQRFVAVSEIYVPGTPHKPQFESGNRKGQGNRPSSFGIRSLTCCSYPGHPLSVTDSSLSPPKHLPSHQSCYSDTPEW